MAQQMIADEANDGQIDDASRQTLADLGTTTTNAAFLMQNDGWKSNNPAFLFLWSTFDRFINVLVIIAYCCL